MGLRASTPAVILEVSLKAPFPTCTPTGVNVVCVFGLSKNLDQLNRVIIQSDSQTLSGFNVTPVSSEDQVYALNLLSETGHAPRSRSNAHKQTVGAWQ